MARNPLKIGTALATALSMVASTMLPLSAKTSIYSQPTHPEEWVASDRIQPLLHYADRTHSVPKKRNCTQAEINRYIELLNHQNDSVRTRTIEALRSMRFQNP